ncbi:MAG: hypothetical protein GC129_03230 [Proteobacteria bacterium]|nr:hypothetical protein [Pseudomonadota bacterium]
MAANVLQVDLNDMGAIEEAIVKLQGRMKELRLAKRRGEMAPIACMDLTLSLNELKKLAEEGGFTKSSVANLWSWIGRSLYRKKTKKRGRYTPFTLGWNKGLQLGMLCSKHFNNNNYSALEFVAWVRQVYGLDSLSESQVAEWEANFMRQRGLIHAV